MRCERSLRRARPELPTPSRPLPGVRGLVLGACALLVWVACGDDSGGGPGGWEGGSVSVELTRVVAEPIRDEVALTGQLDAENQGTIKSELSGVITAIEFDEGQSVVAGSVLFHLDDREQRARLMEAQAELRLAKDVWDRVQRLATQDVSSLARRAEAESKLDKAKAGVVLARLEVERATVRAPFDGVMGVRHVAPGDRVQDEEPLTSIFAIDRLQAIFAIQERGVTMARTGLPIHVRVQAYPGERFAGEVYFVSPNLDPSSRRLIMKAWIENPDHRLKPGMFVNVDVEIARKAAALMVPEASILYDRNGIFIWRQGEEGKAEKLPVELGLRQEGRVEILSGLSAGDVVVSAGIHKVKAGSVLADPRGAETRPSHAGRAAEDEDAS